MSDLKNKLVPTKSKSNKIATVDTSTFNLSNSQVQAMDSIKDWYINNRSLTYTLSGSAGTGKTWLIDYILKTLLSKKRTIVTAPTHKAVRVIEGFTGTKGATLHSIHGLRPNFNFSSFNIDKLKFESLGTNKFANYDIIIADESSMIGSDLAKLNDLRSIQYKTKIIYLGDRLQLLAVGENRISKVFDAKYQFDLQDIIRQKEDNPIIRLLTILRDDVKTNKSNFLNHIKRNKTEIVGEHGYSVINTKQFKDYSNAVFTSNEFKNNIDAYKIATFTNASVNFWNQYARSIITDDTNLITIGDRLMGYKTIVDDFLSPIIINGNDYIVKSVETRMSDDGFKVFDVMIEDYLTGFIKTVYIVDHTDKTFNKYYNKVCELHRTAMYSDLLVRGSNWKMYYHYKDTFMTMIDFDLVYNHDKQGRVTREIDYNYSASIHKL